MAEPNKVTYIDPKGRELSLDEVRALPPKDKIEAAERGFRWQGRKEGRQAERTELFARLGVKNMDEATELFELRKRPTIEEERKHVIGNRWRGRFEGAVVGGAMIALAIFAMQGVIWDTATRAFREQAMTGAILSSHDRAERGVLEQP